MKTSVKKKNKLDRKKTITITVICCALAVLSILGIVLYNVRYSLNGVHTPYDNISDLGKYVRLAKYGIEMKNSDLKDMMDSEIKSFIRSNATELLVGGNVNDGGTANRPVKKGDDVTVNTTIMVYDENGELKPFDSLLDIKEGDTTTTANLKEYVIKDVGNGNFLPEIENALLDGDSYTGKHLFVDVQYDDKVQTEELKNRKVQIEIEILKIVEIVYPEYCDAFIATKTAYKTVAEFEAELQKELLKAYAWSNYIEQCKVLKYPTAKLTRFQDEFKQYYEMTAKDKGMTLEQYVVSLGSDMTTFNSEMQSYATGTVKEEMILYFIAERENLSFTAEEYKTFCEKMVEDYGVKDVEELEKIYTTELVERMLYWELVKEHLYNNIKYVD